MVGSLRQNTQKCARHFYSHQVRDMGMKSNASCRLLGPKIKNLVSYVSLTHYLFQKQLFHMRWSHVSKPLSQHSFMCLCIERAERERERERKRERECVCVCVCEGYRERVVRGVIALFISHWLCCKSVI